MNDEERIEAKRRFDALLRKITTNATHIKDGIRRRPDADLLLHGRNRKNRVERPAVNVT